GAHVRRDHRPPGTHDHAERSRDLSENETGATQMSNELNTEVAEMHMPTENIVGRTDLYSIKSSTVRTPDRDPRPIRVKAREVSDFYGDKQALFEVSIYISEQAVTAFIGPPGCGKSTSLRCFNRMNVTIEGSEVTGRIELDGADIYDGSIDVVELRARVG